MQFRILFEEIEQRVDVGGRHGGAGLVEGGQRAGDVGGGEGVFCGGRGGGVSGWVGGVRRGGGGRGVFVCSREGSESAKSLGSGSRWVAS